MANYLEQSLAKLKEFEGSVTWMYRDTVGKVTVGVGLMLPDAKAAEALPFLAAGRPASPAEIAAEFGRVSTMPMGRPAAFYKHAGSLDLPEATIDAKLRSVLKGFEIVLKKHLPHYNDLPDQIKMALLDMIYNLGPIGLISGFPHLIEAVQSGAWAQAAAHCTRRGPGATRNAWTREQFLGAVVGTIKAEAEGWLTRLWHRLRLMLRGARN